MSVFDEPPPEASSRTPLIVGGIGLLVLASLAAYLLTRAPEDASETAAAPATTARPATAPAARKAGATPPAGAPAEPVARRAAPRPSDTPAPASADTAAPTAATLTIESDVPGASVFVDREFVGTAPVTLEDLAPGTRRIDLSAEGYEGVQRAVDVAPGEHTVTLRFKEVRLNTSVAVSHKHGMGGCDGTLKATIDGLAYETSNRGDAFSLAYAQIETFDVNYLEKNLRVKQRGGRTWNFTDKAAENADKLFVFHRDVAAARDKLAKGFTAAR